MDPPLAFCLFLCGERDEALVKQRGGDEAMGCLGLDRPGQNKKEQSKDHNSIMREKRPDAPDPIIWGGSSSISRRRPRIDRRRTSRGLTPRTGSSGAEQEGPATTLRAGSSREMWPDALGTMVRGRSTRRSPHPRDWSIKGENDGRKRMRHEDKAEVVQQWSQVRMQSKGPRHGDAVIH